MFLKRLFGSSENPEAPASTDSSRKLPPGHPHDLKAGDKSKCPFMSKESKEGSARQKPKDLQEKEKPRGGCPFMHSADDQKNPGLQLYDQAFDSQMVSKFRYYLSRSKIDMYFLEKKRSNRSRARFDAYPLYLQHTLFYNAEDMQKIRTFECCSRFMAYEELREKGNKEYNQGNYAASLDYYERALSLFKWLEHREPVEVPMKEAPSVEEICSKSEIELTESEGSRSRIQLNLENQESEDLEKLLKQGPPKQTDMDEFRLKYKEFFVYYCDENTVLHDGEEMSEKPDTDMRRSLMVQVLLNMAAAYMKLSHYSLARQCCEDAQTLTDKVSQILLRKSQALALNKAASLEDLGEARRLIEQALVNKDNEKIFTDVNKNILKMLNLQDFEEAYLRCREMVLQRTVEAKEELDSYHNKVIQRMEEIHFNEMEIIRSGRTPTERQLDTPFTESIDYRIITRMKDKYIRIVDFYTEGNKPEQVLAAKEQMQEILRVIHAMAVIHSAQLSDVPAQADIGDRDSDKIKKRLDKVKQDHSEVVYNSGRYNFEVLEWAVKEIIEEDRKKEEAEKKKREEEEARLKAAQAELIPQQAKPNSSARYLWLLLLLPLLTILVHRFLL